MQELPWSRRRREGEGWHRLIFFGLQFLHMVGFIRQAASYVPLTESLCLQILSKKCIPEVLSIVTPTFSFWVCIALFFPFWVCIALCGNCYWKLAVMSPIVQYSSAYLPLWVLPCLLHLRATQITNTSTSIGRPIFSLMPPLFREWRHLRELPRMWMPGCEKLIGYLSVRII